MHIDLSHCCAFADTFRARSISSWPSSSLQHWHIGMMVKTGARPCVTNHPCATDSSRVCRSWWQISVAAKSQARENSREKTYTSVLKMLNHDFKGTVLNLQAKVAQLDETNDVLSADLTHIHQSLMSIPYRCKQISKTQGCTKHSASIKCCYGNLGAFIPTGYHLQLRSRCGIRSMPIAFGIVSQRWTGYVQCNRRRRVCCHFSQQPSR